MRQAVADGATDRSPAASVRGNFFEPTILTGVTPGTPAFADEIFGPVLPLIPFDDFERGAGARQRQRRSGCRRRSSPMTCARSCAPIEVLDVGTVVVNHTTAVRVETLPFGGNKGSGNGREGIHDTLREMTKEQTLLLSRSLRAVAC